MKTSQQIAQEIEALQGRRQSVATEAAEAKQRLVEARRRAVTGDSAAAEVVTPAHASKEALDGLLNEIDMQMTALHGQLRDAQVEEKTSADAEAVRELNEQKRANAENYEQRLQNLDNYLREMVSGLAAARQHDGNLNREISALGGVSDVPLLAGRRWSSSGLEYAQYIANMVAEFESKEARRVSEQRRARLKAA